VLDAEKDTGDLIKEVALEGNNEVKE